MLKIELGQTTARVRGVQAVLENSPGRISSRASHYLPEARIPAVGR